MSDDVHHEPQTSVRPPDAAVDEQDRVDLKRPASLAHPPELLGERSVSGRLNESSAMRGRAEGQHAHSGTNGSVEEFYHNMTALCDVA